MGEKLTLGPVMVDQILNALSDVTRRRILLLIAQDNPRSREEFIPDTVDDEGETEYMISLHHVHFPFLDDAGFINWGREADTIERGDNFEYLKPFLRVIVEHQGPGEAGSVPHKAG
ncbi:hypothetical protein SAMN05216388_100968 [Halorientalis persicus]|uniref:Transcriptional regulator n=1 Tax=Halorientalis persicus TaxID=1367881 RepID=A0A1H8MNZ6_9EURY|nr:helix-turn-helix transcriptional regulator [Halorientalis persicus]SEO19039.1 hypothetical protein SAMN05216388_100968 [Halorientalis persicus]